MSTPRKIPFSENVNIKLLQLKQKLICSNPNGLNEALIDAVRAEKDHIVKKLIALKNVDVNYANNWKKTPLIYAAQKGNPVIAGMLIEAKANLDSISSTDSTALLSAIDNGNMDTVIKLIVANASLELDGKSALNLAAKEGKLNMVELLIAAKAKVNFRNTGDMGQTPLIHATKNGHDLIVKHLLKAKAKPNLYTAFSALHEAAKHGYSKCVDLLLKAKADVNALVLHETRTPITTAAEGGYIDIVQQLLDAKAEITHCGSEALPVAAFRGFDNIVELLYSKNSQVLERLPPKICVARASVSVALQGYKKLADKYGDEEIYQRALTVYHPEIREFSIDIETFKDNLLEEQILNDLLPKRSK
ncbi:MAG TPA: ankyrin repeat domain-containing protein [Gammaproteobacteria bacterium]|jgi:ankyrin repeat protein|nr:ankyrin repeat domain-containing protein [Gammaproteobacteria bacterium]